MKKTFYFLHDYNARSDPKLQAVLIDHGAAGLGVFWCIVEQLYEQGGELPLRSCRSIAFALHIDCKTVESIVNDYELFDNNGEIFWSPSIKRRIGERDDISRKRKEAALKRWESMDDKQEQCKCIDEKCKSNAIKLNKIKLNNNKYIDISEDKSSSISLSNSCESDTENVAGSSSSSDLFQVPENSEETQREDEVALLPKHYKQIQDFWNDTISRTSATFSKVAAISDVRKKKIQVRWREFAKVGNPVEVCRTIFENACSSKFLQGDSRNGWKASFDWIFHNEQNWVKVYEGRFNDKGGGGAGTHWNSFTKDMSEIGDYFDSKMEAEYGEQDRNSESPDEQ